MPGCPDLRIAAVNNPIWVPFKEKKNIQFTVNTDTLSGMDPALLKERAAFINRAKAQPAVEKRKHADTSSHSSKKHKSSSSSKQKISNGASASKTPFDYKTSHGSSQYKFGILAKIVKYMKTRHQDGQSHGLTLDDILDETNQLDVPTKHRHWLLTEALKNNPKIKTLNFGNEQKFLFNPSYDIRDKKGLLNLLKKHDLHGLGGILQEDIEEALPRAEKCMKNLGDNIVYVVRPHDKKKVLFYNDKYCRYSVDEEFQKLWRGVSVEGMDERKIEEYLDKQGISSMQDVNIKKVVHTQKRRKGKKNNKFKKLNEHLDGVLQDYSEKQ